MKLPDIKTFKDFLLSMLSDGEQVSSKRVNGTLCVISAILIVLTAIVLALTIKVDIPNEVTALIIAVFSSGLVLLGAGALVDIFKK